MYKYILLNIFVIVCCSSGCKDENKEYKKKELSSNNRILKMLATAETYENIFKLDKIIDLETTKESLIGEIEDILILKGKKILILDKSNAKILLFDSNGKFITKIGKKGMGPGEYIRPGPFAAGNNKIAIYSRPGKLLLFTLKGELIDEINFNKNKWRIVAKRMIAFRNDLYLYNTNIYYNVGIDGKRNIVFRLKNFTNYDKSFGTPLKSRIKGANWDGGDITNFNGKLIYTGIFNGKLYEINPTSGKVNTFADLGQLYDLEKALKSKNPALYLAKHIRELDAIENIHPIKNFLFVLRTQGNLTVIDEGGNIINRNIKYNLQNPENYEGHGLRKLFIFYDEGIISASNKKMMNSENYFPNPSLIFYTLK